MGPWNLEILGKKRIEKTWSHPVLAKMFHLLIYFYVRTFNNVLLDVQDVELASAIDHVTLAEVDAVTRVACLDLLKVKTGTQCIQKS